MDSLSVGGRVVMQHQIHGGDVPPPGGHVGAQQHTGICRPKGGELGATGLLGQFALKNNMKLHNLGLGDFRDSYF